MLALLAVLLAGCGSSTKHLSLNDEAKLAQINSAFASTVLDGSQYGATLKGVDELIALCRAQRDALYEPSKGHFKTVKQVMEDDANTLRQYRPELAGQLDRVLNDNCA